MQWNLLSVKENFSLVFTVSVSATDPQQTLFDNMKNHSGKINFAALST